MMSYWRCWAQTFAGAPISPLVEIRYQSSWKMSWVVDTKYLKHLRTYFSEIKRRKDFGRKKVSKCQSTLIALSSKSFFSLIPSKSSFFSGYVTGDIPISVNVICFREKREKMMLHKKALEDAFCFWGIICCLICHISFSLFLFVMFHEIMIHRDDGAYNA